MHLINDQLYVDLSDYIDLPALEAIKNDILIGMVKSRNGFHESSARYHNYLDQTYPSLLNTTADYLIRDPANPYHKYYKKLNFNRRDCVMFTKLAGEYQQMGQVLYLRVLKDPSNITTKYATDENVDTPWFNNFPELREWISNLKIFDQVGRVLMWTNAPGEPGAIHRDSYVGWPDHFVLINLDPHKKEVFILDDDGNRHTIKSKACVFDIRNYHGSQGKDFPSWTFRVDGLFNEEWARSIGIWEHFKPT